MTRNFASFAMAVSLVALASCGVGSKAKNQTNGEAKVDDAALTRLTLTSDAFQDGQQIPPQFTCDGANRAPAIHWPNAPAATKSFALVLDDPDAPGGTFRHWGLYNIQASARSLGGPHSGTEVTNDFGKPGYGGPCPPKGHGPHHYHFKLFALDVERLELGPDAKVSDVERAATSHAIAQGELVGTYERR